MTSTGIQGLESDSEHKTKTEGLLLGGLTLEKKKKVSKTERKWNDAKSTAKIFHKKSKSMADSTTSGVTKAFFFLPEAFSAPFFNKRPQGSPTGEKNGDMVVNFPVQGKQEYRTIHIKSNQIPEKFRESNQFTKRLLFDCRARVKSLKSRCWHSRKKRSFLLLKKIKKKGMYWTHAFVFLWSLFVEALNVEEEVVGFKNQPQVMRTHTNTHSCSVFKRNV